MSGFGNIKKSQHYSNAAKECSSVVKSELCFSVVLIEDPRKLTKKCKIMLLVVVLAIIHVGISNVSEYGVLITCNFFYKPFLTYFTVFFRSFLRILFQPLV